MKILSEKTNKEYASVEECLAAEEAFEAEQTAKREAEEKALAERKAKEEAIAQERKADAEEVDKARAAMIEATKAYRETLARFCEKHGAYHRTYRFNNFKDVSDLWNSFFDSWF